MGLSEGYKKGYFSGLALDTGFEEVDALVV